MRFLHHRPAVDAAHRRRRTLIAAVVTGAVVLGGGATAAVALAAAPTAPAAAAASPSADAPAGPTVRTAGFPTGGVGIFTDTCTRTTTAANDPILMPGMTGKSMQHDFFGNTATTASSTPAQLLGGSTSCSTSADASAYWTPVLYQNGAALSPKNALIYWRAPSSTAPHVQTVPAGLTMVAGNESATAPQGVRVVQWTCSGAQGRGSATPHDCADGRLLRLVITFPNCWDGKSLNGKAQTNVVYTPTPKGACPASHPVQIPQVVFHANYPTSSAAGLTLSIGPDATGPVTTAHADFMNGWNGPIVAADVRACIDTRTRCGPVVGAEATPRGGKLDGRRVPAARRAERHAKHAA